MDLNFSFVKGWRDGFVGVAMVLMMIFRPTGLWPSRQVALEIGGEEEKSTTEPPSPVGEPKAEA